jgi:hypothetical protein
MGLSFMFIGTLMQFCLNVFFVLRLVQLDDRLAALEHKA